MTDPSTDLQFEHATYEQAAPTAVTCGMCKKPVGPQYWQWIGRVLCDNCRQQVRLLEAHAAASKTFMRAALQATGTAVGCGIAYAVFVGVAHIQFALITIGIAYLIAWVIRKATHNVSGRRYQVLAVVLTYGAASMGYAPSLWNGLTDPGSQGKHAGHATKDAPASTSSTPTHEPAPATPETPATTDTAAPEAPPSLGTFLKIVGILFGVLLAAPFLEATSAPLGLLIIGFGLWEAWRRTRPLSMAVSGPHTVPTAAATP